MNILRKIKMVILKSNFENVLLHKFLLISAQINCLIASLASTLY